MRTVFGCQHEGRRSRSTIPHDARFIGDLSQAYGKPLRPRDSGPPVTRICWCCATEDLIENSAFLDISVSVRGSASVPEHHKLLNSP